MIFCGNMLRKGGAHAQEVGGENCELNLRIVDAVKENAVFEFCEIGDRADLFERGDVLPSDRCNSEGEKANGNSHTVSR
jgi:hypothetical protein